jgi:hypothetical protein
MENENPQEPQPEHHGRNIGRMVSYLFVISAFVLIFANVTINLLNAGWIPKVSFYSGDPKLLLTWIGIAAFMLEVVGLYITMFYAYYKKDQLCEVFSEMTPESVLETKVWYALLITANALLGTTYQSPLQYTWVLFGLAFAYVRFSIDEYIKSQGDSHAVE